MTNPKTGTMTRILALLAAAAVATAVILVGPGRAGAQDAPMSDDAAIVAAMPRLLDLVQRVLAEDVERVPQRSEGSVVLHPTVDMSIVEPGAPPVDADCDCSPEVTIVPLVPVQMGWSWAADSFTVTNHDVVEGVHVNALYGPGQTPLVMPTMLAPGQSLTIPPAPCGERVSVFVNNGALPMFKFC